MKERHEGAYSRGPCHLAITASYWAPHFIARTTPPLLSSSSWGPTQNFAVVEFGSSWSFWQRFNNLALPPSPPPITSSHHRWWGRRRQRWLNGEDSIKKKGSSYNIISSCVVLPPWPWVCVYTHHGTCKKKLLIFFGGWGLGGRGWWEMTSLSQNKQTKCGAQAKTSHTPEAISRGQHSPSSQ